MFDAPFSRLFRPPFGPGLSAANQWWLSGGINAANCVAAYQPKGAASLTASYTNLANPGTYNAAPGVAPGWTASGWSFDGLSAYLTTGIIFDFGYSVIARMSNTFIGATNNYLFGAASPSYFVGMDANNGAVPNTVLYRYNAVQRYAPLINSGSQGMSTGGGYRNGISDGPISASPFVGTVAILLGCYNNNGVPANYAKLDMQAFAIYNTTLTPSQFLSLHTAMMAL